MEKGTTVMQLTTTTMVTVDDVMQGLGGVDDGATTDTAAATDRFSAHLSPDGVAKAERRAFGFSFGGVGAPGP
jgi:hypothetical protein